MFIYWLRPQINTNEHRIICICVYLRSSAANLNSKNMKRKDFIQMVSLGLPVFYKDTLVHDFFIKNTAADVVKMELDLYWIGKAGYDLINVF